MQVGEFANSITVCSFANKFSHPYENVCTLTGKSFSEALILESTNPQYDKILFIELQVQYMKIARSQHAQNMLCT